MRDFRCTCFWELLFSGNYERKNATRRRKYNKKRNRAPDFRFLGWKAASLSSNYQVCGVAKLFQISPTLVFSQDAAMSKCLFGAWRSVNSGVEYTDRHLWKQHVNCNLAACLLPVNRPIDHWSQDRWVESSLAPQWKHENWAVFGQHHGLALKIASWSSRWFEDFGCSDFSGFFSSKFLPNNSTSTTWELI